MIEVGKGYRLVLPTEEPREDDEHHVWNRVRGWWGDWNVHLGSPVKPSLLDGPRDIVDGLWPRVCRRKVSK